MKKMKMKLMASLAMLVIAAIMVSSTSYAWYTINKEASVGDVSITLAMTENVEIAKANINSLKMPKEVTTNDAPSQYNFGGKITFDGGTNGKLDLPATQAESDKLSTYTKWKSDAADIKAGDILGVVYGGDGRTKGFQVATPWTDPDSGISYYRYKYDNEQSMYAKIAISYNMFIRSNKDGNIAISYDIDKTKTFSKATVRFQDFGIIGTDSGDVAEDANLTLGDWKTPAEISDGVTGIKDYKANHVYLVQFFAYVDGDMVKAENFTKADGSTTDMDASIKNLKFYNTAITGAHQTWEPGLEDLNTLTAGDTKVTGLNESATYEIKGGTQYTDWTELPAQSESVDNLTNNTAYSFRLKGTPSWTKEVTPVATSSSGG